MRASIGKLTSLEELQLYNVDKSPDFTTDLGKLTQLRVLEIKFDEIDESMHKALVKSMHNLRKIQSIDISSESRLQADDGWEEWNPLSGLREFSLSGISLPRRPSWMDPSRVPHLFSIWLMLDLLEAGDLHILGRLPSLRILVLMCDNTVGSYTFCSHEFQNLTYLYTNTEIVCEGSALPMLEELAYYVWAGDSVGFMGNIPSLHIIKFFLLCRGRSREEVEAALRQAAETHPNRPYLQVRRI